jgi:hypothetical protein
MTREEALVAKFEKDGKSLELETYIYLRNIQGREYVLTHVTIDGKCITKTVRVNTERDNIELAVASCRQWRRQMLGSGFRPGKKITRAKSVIEEIQQRKKQVEAERKERIRPVYKVAQPSKNVMLIESYTNVYGAKA